MEDEGNNTNALSGSGHCIGVMVAVARRKARVVLRAVAWVVVEKQ